MFNLILILGGILLASVLVVENMVNSMIGYLFLDPGTNVGVIVLVSVAIGIAIGYGIKGRSVNKYIQEKEEDEYYF